MADGDPGWDEHARQRVRDWLDTTPAQRLAWLQEAIVFARRAGALEDDPTETEHTVDQHTVD